MNVIKAKSSPAELEQWMDNFVSMGTEALRYYPRDAEALHKGREKELLAKIGDLTMLIDVLQIARDYLGESFTRREHICHAQSDSAYSVVYNAVRF